MCIWNCDSNLILKCFLFNNLLKYFFLFFKIIFDISILKRSENIKKLFYINKIKLNFKGMQVALRS